MHDEHVQPVQSLTPDRRGGRLRAVVAAVAPLALLAVVVSGGFLGRIGEPEDPRTVLERPAIADDATPPPDRSVLPPPVDLADAGFPTDTLGLPVRSVTDTLERIRGGRLRERVVAVAGWLTIQPPSAACRNEVDRGTGPTALCSRETILVGSPGAVLEVGAGGDTRRLRPVGPHLHAVAPPGVALGQRVGRLYRGLAPSRQPRRVVIVGRIEDPRVAECRPSGRHCGEVLALERLVWVDGEWQDRRALVTTPTADGSDAAAVARRRAIEAAAPGAGTLLSEILVPRDALPGVDREAAAAVDDAVEGAVWYTRFLVRVAGPGGSYPRDVGWAVVDDASGTVVAAARSEATATGAVFPGQVVGIATVDAGAAGRLAAAGVGPDRLVAVAGWLTLAPDDAECAGAEPPCRRSGLLADVPTVDGGGALFVETRPDVTVSGDHEPRTRADSWSVPSPAVAVGRFLPRNERECGLRRPTCEAVFTVELLAWLDGAAVQETASPARDGVTESARSAIRGAGEVLGATLVERSALATLEPGAAAAADGDGRVWLVRTVSFRARQDMWYEPLAGWAVVDDATGKVLVAHPSLADGLGWRP